MQCIAFLHAYRKKFAAHCIFLVDYSYFLQSITNSLNIMIERNTYMSALYRWKDKKTVKVVTGIRRCGKSSLLRMYRESLLSEGTEADHIQDINFEDLENEPLLDYRALYAHVKSKLYSTMTQ